MKKRKPGRPIADVPLTERILFRTDKKTRRALEQFARNAGPLTIATALRVIVRERMAAEGLL